MIIEDAASDKLLNASAVIEIAPVMIPAKNLVANKKANGENYNSGFHSSDTPKWSAVQIKRILTNEVYIRKYGSEVKAAWQRIY